MFLAATVASGVGFHSGRFWRFDDRAAAAVKAEHFRQLFLPYGVSAGVGGRPSVSQYEDRLYVTGGYSDNLVLDEHERIHRLGMMAPTTAPEITGAAGTGVIGYLSFWDELTDEHSALSGGKQISNATPRTWNNLPTYEPNDFMYPHGYISLLDEATDRVRPTFASGVSVDTLSPLFYMRPGDKISLGSGTIAHLEYPGTGDSERLFTATLFGDPIRYTNPVGKPRQRASHACLWLSVAGGLPRLVTKVRLGTTTVIEGVPTASLAEAHPGNFERFPVCNIGTIYRDRLLMAGDAGALDTVYLSAIGLPERYEGFKFRTRNGEAVTGLLGTRDYCLVMTESSTYLLQGFTEDDMVMTLQDNGIGACAHHTNVVVHGTPYVTNRDGIFMFNGTWHPVMLGATRSFAQHFAANRGVYQNSFMVNNPVDKTIQLFLSGYDLVTYTLTGNDIADLVMYENYSWVVNYSSVQPQAGGGFGPGMISMDRFWITSQVYEDPNYGDVATTITHSVFLSPEGGRPAHFYHATGVGEIYREKENVAFEGESIILTPTYLFDAAGGYETEGKTLVKFWTHASAEDTGFYACALGGDEWVGFQSFLTSTASHGIDSPARLANRLWGTMAGRVWPNSAVAVNGFSVEKYAHTVAASFLNGSAIPPWRDPLSDPAESWVATPKSVHEHPLPDRVSGRGLAFLYFMVNPRNITWRGVGGYFVPGIATRPYFYVSVWDA